MKFMLPRVSIKVERWKYHKGVDAYISTFGNIKNKDGELQSVCKRNGYLWYRGKQVHRLVMETWKPMPGYMFLTVDHLNHNTYQNDIWNLEYVTQEENVARDKADIQLNAPKEEEIPAPTSAVKLDEAEVEVLLNNVRIPMTAAKQIMRADKSIGSSAAGKKKVDETFEKALKSGQTISYGNFTVKKAA